MTASADQASELGFKEIWEEAQKRFQLTTKKSLKNPLSLDEALAAVAQRFDPKDPKDGEKQAKIKGYATNMINFIQLLGGLAAQGASMIFGPADMCFNALQAILDIPGKISRLHDHLALLFEEISTFMKQFQIYKRIEEITALSVEFRQTVHKLMIAFVDVSAMCVKFCNRSTFRVFKQMSKLILFDNDSGVSDALETFRRLSKQHAAVSDATTLERVVQAQHEAEGNHRLIWDKLNESAEENSEMFQKVEESLDALVEDAKERQNMEKRVKIVKSLCDKLNITENEQKRQEKFKQLQLKALQGSGAWLEDLDNYQRWSSLEENQESLLLISGPPGSGRSVLMSIMLQKIETRFRRMEDKRFRFCTAVYKFESNEKVSSQNTSTALSQSIQAIGSAAIQFAERYTFAKSLNVEDISVGKDTPIEHLFEGLLSPTDTRYTKNMPYETFYYFFIEDVDQLPTDEAQRLISVARQSQNSHLKIAISGTDERLDECVRGHSKIDEAFARIRIQEHNDSDIKLCIEHELTRDKIFQSDTTDVQPIVRDIRDKLPNIAQGRFSNVALIIDRVRNALQSDMDVDDVLSLISETTLDSTDELCRKIVQDLRRTLGPPEIEQLNELLIWTIYGARYFQIEQMRSVIFFLMNKNMFQDLTIKVNEKFSKLLKIDEDGDFVLADPNMYEYFRNLPRMKRTEDENDTSDEPRISMQITIKNARISQVQRFCWDLGEKFVLDRMNTFIPENSTAGHEAERPIGVNQLDGDLIILNKCFELLQGEPKEQTTALAGYAIVYAFRHLPPFETEDDKQKLTLAEKQNIVKQLVFFLMQDPDALDAHLTSDFFTSMSFLDEEALGRVKAFLSDNQAIGELRYRQRDWASRVTAKNVVLALEGVAKLVASHWLCRTGWDPSMPYAWLAHYIERLQEVETSDISQDESDSDPSASVKRVLDNKVADHSPDDDGETHAEVANEIAVETIPSTKDRVLQAAEWAYQRLGSSTKNALWYERLGWTYLDQSRSDTIESSQVPHMRVCARTAFTLAKTMADRSWLAFYGLAELSSTDNRFEDAVTEMDVALSELRLLASPTETETEKLIAGLMLSAEWQIQLEQSEQAVQRFQEVITLTPASSRGRYELLKHYCDSQQGSRAVDLLEKLSQQPEPNNESTQLSTLLVSLCSRPDPLECMEVIFGTTKECDTFSTVLEALEGTHDLLQQKRNTDDNNADTAQEILITLKISQSVALAYYSTVEDRIEVALAHLKECIQYGLELDDVRSNDHLLLLGSRLFLSLYFSQTAMKHEITSESPDHISEVKTIMHDACNHEWHGSHVRLMLAGYLRLVEERKEIEKLLTVDVQMAFGLLSDADPDNDMYAYVILAEVLLCTGDLLNALTAASLLGPPERRAIPGSDTKEPEGSSEVTSQTSSPSEALRSETRITETEQPDVVSGLECDGTCEGARSLTWSTDVWYCTICYNTGFCYECLEKLRAGTLTRRVCSANHNWILVPSCRSEYLETGAAKVRVGGKLPPSNGPLQDGHRIGGEIVPIEEWLDSIRASWGIEKKTSTEVDDD